MFHHIKTLRHHVAAHKEPNNVFNTANSRSAAPFCVIIDCDAVTRMATPNERMETL